MGAKTRAKKRDCDSAVSAASQPKHARASSSNPSLPYASNRITGGKCFGAVQTSILPCDIAPELVSGLSNHWALKVDPKTCEICHQNTHEIDRDCDPSKPHYLGWPKSDYDDEGTQHPIGRSCGPCEYTRVRYWVKGTTLEKLMDLRSDDAVNNRFLRLRADKVFGKCIYIKDPAEVPTLSHLTSEKDAQYSKTFDAGDVYELRVFAEGKGIEHEHLDDDKLVVTLRALGYRVERCDDGEWGVFSSTLPKGVKARFQDGSSHSKSQIRQMAHATAEDARRELLSDLTSQGSPPPKSSPTVPASPSSHISVNSSQHPNQRSVERIRRAHENAPPYCHSSSRMDESDLDPDDSVSQVGTEASASTNRSGHTQPQLDASPPPSKGKGKKKKKDAKAPWPSKGNCHLEYGRAVSRHLDFIDIVSQLWNKEIRYRDYENVLSRTSAAADKLATMSAANNIEAGRISDELYAKVTEMEQQNELIKLVNDEIVAIVENARGAKMQPELITTFQKLPATLQSNMLSSAMHHLLNKKGWKSSVLALKMASVTTDGSFGVGLLLSRFHRPEAEMRKLAAGIQKLLVVSFINSVSKKSGESDFVSIMKEAGQTIGQPTLKFEEIAKGIKDETIQPFGWSNQSYVDLAALQLFGKVLENGATTKMSRGLRQSASLIYAQKPRLSHGLQTNMRVAAGTKSNAKSAHDIIAKQLDDVLQMASALTPDQLGMLRGFIKTLTEDAKDEDSLPASVEEFVYETLAQFFEEKEHIDTLISLAKCIDQIPGDLSSVDAETQALIDLKNELLKAILDAMYIVLTGYDWFAACLEGVLSSDVHNDEFPAGMFNFAIDIFEVLLHFDLEVDQKSAISEALQRCRVVSKLSNILVDLEQHQPIENIKKFAALQEEHLKIVNSTTLSENDDAKPLQDLSSRLQNGGIARPMATYMQQLVGSDKCGRAPPALVARVEELQHVLPVEVVKLASGAKVYRSTQYMHEQIESCKTSSCMQIAKAFVDIGSVVEPVASMKDFMLWAARIKSEWKIVFADVLAHVKEATLDEFLATHKPTMQAIKDWNFQTCMWMKETERNEELEKAMRLVAGMVKQPKRHFNTVGSLFFMISQLSWISSEEKSALLAAHSNRDQIIEKTKEAAVVLSHIVLANGAVTSSLGSMQYDFVAGLGVSLNSMCESLQKRLPSVESIKIKKSASSSQNTDDAQETQVIAPEQEEQPKKRYRPTKPSSKKAA